jgi:hypothetical protein
MKRKWVHSGERPFVCDVCDMAFIWKRNLVQHKGMHIEREGKHLKKKGSYCSGGKVI